MRVLLRDVLLLSVLAALTCSTATSACIESNITNGTQTSGALYRVYMPELTCWNGDFIVFAHGYVAPNEPLAIPEDQLTIGGEFIPGIMNQLGYGFAISSYSKNGLAIQEGVSDLQDLVQNVIQPPAFPSPSHVYLVGASEGGLVATLSAEQLPQVYNATLAACGPVGSFQRQINYFGDFRVVFDYFFPGLIPGSPVNIPQDVMDGWYSLYVPRITIALAQHPLATAQLLKVMRAPVTSDPASVAETVLGVLWYNVFATNDANATLGGQPFDNHFRLYTGSYNDFRLNLRVERFTADNAARVAIADHYETSGRLMMPEVTIHTLADPIVPYWQETLYTAKTILAGTALRRINIPVLRYGHCSFQIGELLTAFGLMILRDQGTLLSSQIESVLPEQQRSEFRALAQKHKLNTR